MRPSDLGLPARFKEFRRYPGFDQLQMAAELALAAERFQVANLPTGAGKSLTAVTAAHLRGGRFLVLTGTKNLESQYFDDGLVQGIIHSHRNYRCASFREDADDPEFRCAWPRNQCLWMKDVEAVLAARGSVTNYAYWLAIARYGDPDLLGAFDYLILDESHSAPQWLTDALAVTITASRLNRVFRMSQPKIPDYSDDKQGLARISRYLPWLNELAVLGLKRLSEIPQSERSERRKVERLVGDIAWISRVPAALESGEYKEPWVVCQHADSSAPGVTFTPRWGSDFAEQFLFRQIPHVLLTSATVTRDHARYLGIPDSGSSMRYREAPSPFDVRRRPIIWVPTVRVDYRMSDGGKWKLWRQIDDIIEQAIEQRAGAGIIHTGSYERNQEMVRSLERYGPLIITHRKDSRDFRDQFERFLQKSRRGEFAVFASPRIQEGVNLPDADCRWQVILKAMAAIDARDPLTKARLDDPRYRNLVTAEGIKQMCGRPVRGEDDFATTIVVDDYWKVVRGQCPFEEWFRAAFQELRAGQRLTFLTQQIVDGFGTAMPAVGPSVHRPVLMIG